MHHLDGKGIALLGPVEGYDYDRRSRRGRGRIVRDSDVLGGKVSVRLRHGDGWWSGNHDGAMG